MCVATGASEESRESASELLERLMALHTERAYRIAWRMVGGDAAVAEEVAQEAFVQAYKGLSRFRGDSDLGTWLYRIVVNEAMRHHRRERTRTRVYQFFGGAEPEVAPPLPDPPLQARIVAALEELTAGERAAVVLVHLEQFTVVETAALLRKRPGTVKSQLHRGLRKLRELLGEDRETR